MPPPRGTGAAAGSDDAAWPLLLPPALAPAPAPLRVHSGVNCSIVGKYSDGEERGGYAISYPMPNKNSKTAHLVCVGSMRRTDGHRISPLSSVPPPPPYHGDRRSSLLLLSTAHMSSYVKSLLMQSRRAQKEIQARRSEDIGNSSAACHHRSRSTSRRPANGAAISIARGRVGGRGLLGKSSLKRRWRNTGGRARS